MGALAKLGKSKMQAGKMVPAMLLTALLTACAAPPPPAPVVATPAPAPAPAPAAVAGVPDFTQITQTSCPGTAASYDEWVARFGAYALHQGQREPVIRLAFADVTENPKIRDRAGKQAEFVTPVWTYLDRAVSAERIAKGQAKLPEVRGLAAQIEAEYGVSAATLMGIWGIETDFGNNFGDVNVFEALSNAADARSTFLYMLND